MRPRRLNPASTSCRLPSVRTKRPVLTRSTSESAIWTTISAWLRRERPPLPSVRVPPWNCAVRSTRVARSAGASPKSSAVATVTAMVKPSTRASSGRSSTTGRCRRAAAPAAGRGPTRRAPCRARRRRTRAAGTRRRAAGRRGRGWRRARGAGRFRGAARRRARAAGSRRWRTRRPARG